MCTCWLAHYYAQLGQHDRADAILRDIESTSATGLLAEAIKDRTGGQLGDTPLLFSQVEFVRRRAQAGVDFELGPNTPLLFDCARPPQWSRRGQRKNRRNRVPDQALGADEPGLTIRGGYFAELSC